MALVDTNIHGQSYVFGFDSTSDAPTISNFTPRTAEVKYVPEVNAKATDGEGHVEAVGISKPSKRMANITLTGYISSSFDPSTLSESFSFGGRFYLITSVSQPKKKGEFVEVTIEAESYANVTS